MVVFLRKSEVVIVFCVTSFIFLKLQLKLKRKRKKKIKVEVEVEKNFFFKLKLKLKRKRKGATIIVLQIVKRDSIFKFVADTRIKEKILHGLKEPIAFDDIQRRFGVAVRLMVIGKVDKVIVIF